MIRHIKRFVKKIIYAFPSSRVLMFHHVSDEPEIKKSSCVLSTDKFYKIINNNRERFCSVEDSIRKPSKKMLSITFDDSLADVYTIAYPFLKQNKIPFTIFVLTGLLDTPGYITTEQLVLMAQDPLVTIGAHGVMHDILPSLSYASKQREILESKEVLEKIIGRKVTLFAYSHGQYDKDSLKLVKKYDYAFSAVGFPINFITKRRYLIGRYNIDNSTFEKQYKLLKRE